MTSLKKKLMAAVSMLTVSGMMLTTASFAWFTISTNPEITGITTTVTVNENLELAVAKANATTTTAMLATDAQFTYDGTNSNVANYYTYGNLVDFTTSTTSGSLGYNFAAFLEGTSDETDEDNVVLAPMTFNYTSEDNTDTDGFLYPEYGYDGRVETLAGLTTNDSDGSFGTLVDEDGNIYGYYIDFWMRSNVGGVLELTAATDRADGSSSSASAATGAGSTFTSTNKELADNIAIAFEVIADSNGSVTIADTGATTATNVVVAVVAKDTTTTVEDGATYTTTFTAPTTGLATLVADDDTLIRMYVYLEGAAVTNAAASIDAVLETGTLNVQFGISDTTNGDTDNAMNASLESTTNLATDPGDAT